MRHQITEIVSVILVVAALCYLMSNYDISIKFASRSLEPQPFVLEQEHSPRCCVPARFTSEDQLHKPQVCHAVPGTTLMSIEEVNKKRDELGFGPIDE